MSGHIRTVPLAVAMALLIGSCGPDGHGSQEWETGIEMEDVFEVTRN